MAMPSCCSAIPLMDLCIWLEGIGISPSLLSERKTAEIGEACLTAKLRHGALPLTRGLIE